MWYSFFTMMQITTIVPTTLTSMLDVFLHTCYIYVLFHLQQIYFGIPIEPLSKFRCQSQINAIDSVIPQFIKRRRVKEACGSNFSKPDKSSTKLSKAVPY